MKETVLYDSEIVHPWYKSKLSLCGCIQCLKELEVGAPFIIPIDLQSFSESIYVCRSVYSVFKVQSTTSFDVLMKFCTLTCFGLTTNAIENRIAFRPFLPYIKKSICGGVGYLIVGRTPLQRSYLLYVDAFVKPV